MLPMKNRQNTADIAVALDIGTSKVAAIVGRKERDGVVEILALSSRPSEGLKKGVVVNIEQTVNSIRSVIKEVEVLSGLSISSVCVGVAGSHISSLNCEGAASIRGDEVTWADVDRAMETARAIQLPADQLTLHVLPRDYAIDGQSGIKSPVGMSGYRLNATVHMVTGGLQPIDNIKKCVRRCGLEVSDVVLEQIASSLAVLTEDEKELGVCLVDIGGGTSDIVVFSKGAEIHTSVIPVGGDHVTNDIAVSWRTPTKNAEEIKVKYGCALEKCVGENETIEAPGVADRPSRRIERRALARIIEPRYEELFELVIKELKKEGLDKQAVTGFVLTGGSSKMEGVPELAESVFNAPVRIGRPREDQVTGLSEAVNNPMHSTGVGLLLWEVQGFGRNEQMETISTWSKLRSWLQKNF